MDEEENADIAAAMGFASFGGTKKRKFDHANSPKAKADASGANSTQLGVRTKKVASTEEKDVNGLATDTATQDICPTTQPQEPLGSGLAAFLARGQTLPEKPSSAQHEQAVPAQSDRAATEMVSFGGPQISRAELNALRHGVQLDNGDTAYFLPSFVEDPWERLRKGGRG
jgi:hypothetical protein